MRRVVIMAVATMAVAFTGSAWAQGKGKLGVVDVDSCQTITSAGSYRIVTDIDAGFGTVECIVIAANDVQLDGNGFTVRGGGAGSIAVESRNPRNGIDIFNLHVANADTGIDLSSTEFARLDNITAVTFVGDGAEALMVGNFSTISNSRVEGRAVPIVSAGTHSLIDSNIVVALVSGGSVDGIEAGVGSTIVGNTVKGDNSGTGLIGACPSTVIGNTVDDFTTARAFVDPGSCTFANNTPL